MKTLTDLPVDEGGVQRWGRGGVTPLVTRQIGGVVFRRTGHYVVGLKTDIGRRVTNLYGVIEARV